MMLCLFIPMFIPGVLKVIGFGYKCYWYVNFQIWEDLQNLEDFHLLKIYNHGYTFDESLFSL